MNVADIVKETAARIPAKTALIFQDKPITYAELDRSINEAAAGVASLGIRKGDRVGVLVHNVPHFAYAYRGIERAGGVMVPLNTMFTAHEISYILADAEARAVIVAEPFLRAVDGLRETLPLLEHVVVVGGGAPIGTMAWDQMTGRGGDAPAVVVGE